MWRALLFVPILNERLVASAARRGADAIVLDLEAAVPFDRKEEARGVLAERVSNLRAAHVDIAVRVNALDFGGDIDIVDAVKAGADIIVLPQATPASVEMAADLAGTTPLIPLIETPRGVIDALSIAEAAPNVAGLGFGVEDYAANMGAPPSPELLAPAAFQVVQAARAAGVQPLVLPDTIADYADIPRFEASAQHGRQMAAAGGFAIHPSQVEVLRQVFTPTEEECCEAQAIIDAAEQARRAGQAIASLNGRMIDAPIEALAQRVLSAQSRFSR